MLKALHSTVRRRIDSELSFQCLSVKAYRLFVYLLYGKIKDEPFFGSLLF